MTEGPPIGRKGRDGNPRGAERRLEDVSSWVCSPHRGVCSSDHDLPDYAEAGAAMVVSKVKLFGGEVEFTDHASVAEARRYCRMRYTADERVESWQVVCKVGGDLVHYTQPEHERQLRSHSTVSGTL